MKSKLEQLYDLFGLKEGDVFQIIPQRLPEKVSADEYFRIQTKLKCPHRFTSKLEIAGLYDPKEGWVPCIIPISLSDLFLGNFRIARVHKEVQLTENDKCVVRYAQLAGFNWLAKDEDGEVFAYVNKPEREEEYKNWYDPQRGGYLQLEVTVEAISWEDDPLYIGDDDE